MPKMQAGFTLVEIAVVLVIVGLLVGSFIGTFAERIDTTRENHTKKELLEIRKALIAYAYTQTPPTLPCPDVDLDGVQDVGGFGCTAGANVGFLPWQTLGMGFADDWDNHYRYWTSVSYSGPFGGFNLGTPDTGGGMGVVQTRINDVATTIVSNAAAVVFSQGKNGLGGVSADNTNRAALPGAGYADENENVDNNALFMSRPPTREGASSVGGIFDDIVVWINTYELKAAMVEAGKLP